MALPDSIITSQGDIIIPSNIARIASKFNTITLWTIDGFQITYTYNNPQLAQSDFILWQNALNSAPLGPTPPALAFSSVAPNTGAVNGGASLVFSGTGFNVFYPYCVGSNFIIIGDDGAGHTFQSQSVAVASLSSTQFAANVFRPAFGPAATYTLYYSEDNGATRATTGLTIVVS